MLVGSHTWPFLTSICFPSIIALCIRTYKGQDAFSIILMRQADILWCLIRDTIFTLYYNDLNLASCHNLKNSTFTHTFMHWWQRLRSYLLIRRWGIEPTILWSMDNHSTSWATIWIAPHLIKCKSLLIAKTKSLILILTVWSSLDQNCASCVFLCLNHEHLLFWKINTQWYLKIPEDRLTAITSVLKVFSESTKV